MAGEPTARAVLAVTEVEPGRVTWSLLGEWTTRGLGALARPYPDPLPGPGTRVVIETRGLTVLDTAGALLLYRLTQVLERAGAEVLLPDLESAHARLIDLVRSRAAPLERSSPPTTGWLETLGRLAWGHLAEGWALLAFIGEGSIAFGRSVLAPRRVRRRALVAILETAGVNAVPIVALLAFLIGVVIAYQGGVQLRAYGANVYVVELVTLTLVRELAPMMTAIIAAGRTGSAFAAQLGTMKVTEEIDALRTIGIDPMDLLVLPRILGLALALPLLTVLADVAGVVGGMAMAAAMLDVSPREFVDRIPQAVSLTSVVIGIVKAPVFAALIAVVGCFQGLRVEGGADSVGRQTTVSVVQAIFLVIVVDAAFSVLFSWLGI